MLNPVTLAATGLLALAAAAALPALPALPAMPALPAGRAAMPEEIPASLDWSIGPRDRSEPAPAGTVEFQLGYHYEHHSSMWAQDIPLATLSGLSEAQLAADGAPVAFVMHRDAGDFRCKGVAGQGRGTGTCAYAANPAFPAALARRGAPGGLQPYQQFQLTLSDIGFAYLDELKREAYATPSTDDLVRAGTHGAGLRQLLAMNAAGYRFGDVATFVRARDHGVSARYIEALKAAGYTKLPAADLVRLRDHGVSATYIAELRDAGYSGLSADEFVHLRDHGVSGGFVAELHAMGYDRLPAQDLARLRDHGVSAGFIRTANQGGTRLSPEDLIRLRDSGGRSDRPARPDRPDRPERPDRPQ
jgi:hypothetical protein